MKTGQFTYHRPYSIEEALELLHAYREGAKIIAGGQSLLPIMNMRLAEPSHLVDVSALPDLRRFENTAAGIRYGAGTTHMMIEEGLVPDITDGLLRKAAKGIGYRAIRTKGTMGGSLVHSDSSAEWPTVLAALDARVNLRSKARGERILRVRDFLMGFFTTEIEVDELLVSVDVSRPGPRTRYGIHKLARQIGDFAQSLVVISRTDSTVEIWVGAAKETPVRLPQTEQLILDRTSSALTVADLTHPISSDLEIDKSTSDLAARHSLQLHAAAVRRALLQTEEVEAHALQEL